MKFEEIDLSEVPARLVWVIDQEWMRWEAYEPTTIEKDIPFVDHWWKYVYWIPRIKKEFYILAISKPEIEIELKCNSLGMDYDWFKSHYRDFFRRLAWMRKNNKYNALGEIP